MTTYQPSNAALDAEFDRMFASFPASIKNYIWSFRNAAIVVLTDDDVDNAMAVVNTEIANTAPGCASADVLAYAANFLASVFDDGDLPTDWAISTLDRAVDMK